MSEFGGRAEKRRESRFEFTSLVKYALSPDTATEYEAFVVNMSRSGLCIALERPLLPGQEIVIKRSILSFLCRAFRIEWIKKVDNSLFETYRAGLTLRNR